MPGDWRTALDDRVRDANELLGAVDGVRGLVLAGSVGRGEPWPLSDLDLVPVYDLLRRQAASAEVERRRSALEGFWGWASWPVSLDVGWLSFTVDEVEQALAAGAELAAAHMAERRWFHGLDKAYGGRALPGSDPRVGEFATWLTQARFQPPVVAARLRRWAGDARSALRQAEDQLAGGDTKAALPAVHRAAEATIDLLTERWGTRTSSLGRRWTRFERLAAEHRATRLAADVLACRGARPHDVAERLRQAPGWLHHRVLVAYQARISAGEPVSPEQNARDQIIAFAQLWSRRHLPHAAWAAPVVWPSAQAAIELLTALADGGGVSGL
jgi:hypothetical protein